MVIFETVRKVNVHISEINTYMKLNTNPTSKQLAEIKSWLVEEKKNFNEGFYCNWNIIENSFNENKLFVLEFDKKIVGFITWTNHQKKYVDIDIMEINRSFRKRGFGRILYKKTEEFFAEHKYIAIKLFCAPENSESFWKKMEFIKFPYRGYSESELIYYKPLINAKELSVGKFLANKIELWNVEPYELKEQEPKWTWEIYNNNYPILQPCNPNWNLRLTKNGQIVKEDKIKYFDSEKEIEFGPFLYLTLTE
ncbi:GNAT family N-acetyltransferase [Kaistella sp. SH11-4b]